MVRCPADIFFATIGAVAIVGMLEVIVVYAAMSIGYIIADWFRNRKKTKKEDTHE